MKNFLIIILCSMLCGCAMLKPDNYSDKYHMTRNKIDWEGTMGFYESCYPDLTRNEKAELIIESMKKENEEFEVMYTYYKIKHTCILFRGKTIWPVVTTKIDGEELETVIVPVKRRINDTSN